MAIMNEVTNIIAEATKIVTDQKDKFLQEYEVANAIDDIKIDCGKELPISELVVSYWHAFEWRCQECEEKAI